MSQEMFVILNLTANTLIFLELVVFIIFLFGKADSAANRFPLITHWFIKVGLSIMCAGALFAALKEAEDMHHSIAIWQQLVRNIGTAMVFGWGVLFHWKYFMQPKPTPKPTRKRKVVKKAAVKPRKRAVKKDTNPQP